jgi:hypothetical protein
MAVAVAALPPCMKAPCKLLLQCWRCSLSLVCTESVNNVNSHTHKTAKAVQQPQRLVLCNSVGISQAPGVLLPAHAALPLPVLARLNKCCNQLLVIYLFVCHRAMLRGCPRLIARFHCPVIA